MSLMFLILVLSTILWSCWIFVAWMKNHCLPLSKLVIVGKLCYTTHNDICQSIMALGVPGTIVTQNVNVIHQQIQKLPWIKQVSVRKQWPDKLKISLVEYVPVARWNDLYMLDNSGQKFSCLTDQRTLGSIPMLYGPQGSEIDVLMGYTNMNQLLKLVNCQIKIVSMSARYSWQLILQDDIKLTLGRKDRIQRLQRFIDMYPILLQQAWKNHKRISYVDLRYQSGFAVGWAPIFIDSKPRN
ncbi:cell division protein FtsQ/DivIB [Candidatus Palibaumannia cicadellinicola]|uniref:Cell division protein FtsQ n=1 Tax=Candidatus Palibaumannia cicadellinicola TaxID=186490 RepID=A0A088MZ02_9GAMM|nr:cell division protein FtsQ/DivIB [Candidatus Baumannia cicadellinicola]AIN47434.1 Cell division protein FtsQ [Candidatus Baumannia cicadellinicola]